MPSCKFFFHGYGSCSFDFFSYPFPFHFITVQWLAFRLPPPDFMILIVFPGSSYSPFLKYGHPYPQHCCQFFTDSGNSHLVSLIIFQRTKKFHVKNIYRNFHCKYNVFNLTFIVTVQYLQNGNRLAWSDICLTLAPLALRLRFSSDLPTNMYYTLPPLLCL